MGSYKSFFYHSMNAVSVVGTLKLYHMLKNLFEIIAIKGNGDRKTLGTSAHARVQGLGLAPTVNAYPRAHEPPGDYLMFWLQIIYYSRSISMSYNKWNKAICVDYVHEIIENNLKHLLDLFVIYDTVLLTFAILPELVQTKTGDLCCLLWRNSISVSNPKPKQI